MCAFDVPGALTDCAWGLLSQWRNRAGLNVGFGPDPVVMVGGVQVKQYPAAGRQRGVPRGGLLACYPAHCGEERPVICAVIGGI